MSTPQNTQSTAANQPAPIARAVEILHTLLERSGMQAKVELERSGRDVVLQIISENDSELIGGEGGKRLADIQYLVNRLLHKEFPTVPRVRVDLGHQREKELAAFTQRIQGLIEEVATKQAPHQLEPLNSYYRRVVHNLIAMDSRVNSWSPSSQDRLKPMTIMPVRS